MGRSRDAGRDITDFVKGDRVLILAENRSIPAEVEVHAALFAQLQLVMAQQNAALLLRLRDDNPVNCARLARLYYQRQIIERRLELIAANFRRPI